MTGQTGPSLTVSYKYDALGRRIEQTSNGAVTKFVYNGASVIADLDGSGNTLARYTLGPRIDEIMAVRRSGNTYYYLQDAVNSVVRVLDASRTTVNSYAYLSWGEIRAQSGTLANRFTYTGRELNTDGRTVYYRARTYSPMLGRFGQEDPLGNVDGVNVYRYATNSPCTNIDPMGTQRAHYQFQCSGGTTAELSGSYSGGGVSITRTITYDWGGSGTETQTTTMHGGGQDHSSQTRTDLGSGEQTKTGSVNGTSGGTINSTASGADLESMRKQTDGARQSCNAQDRVA
jgi:RHS repeat-associated protein